MTRRAAGGSARARRLLEVDAITIAGRSSQSRHRVAIQQPVDELELDTIVPVTIDSRLSYIVAAAIKIQSAIERGTSPRKCVPVPTSVASTAAPPTVSESLKVAPEAWTTK
jgi:hypothetical protein